MVIDHQVTRYGSDLGRNPRCNRTKINAGFTSTCRSDYEGQSQTGNFRNCPGPSRQCHGA